MKLEELENWVDPRSKIKGWKVKVLDVYPDERAGNTRAKVELFNPDGESEGEDMIFIHRKDVKIGKTYDARIDGLMCSPEIIGVDNISSKEVDDIRYVSKDRYKEIKKLRINNRRFKETNNFKRINPEIKHDINQSLLNMLPDFLGSYDEGFLVGNKNYTSMRFYSDDDIYLVFNVKGMGVPNTTLLNETFEKNGLDIDEFEEEINEYIQFYIENVVFEECKKMCKYNLYILGRSGGYWGVRAEDIYVDDSFTIVYDTDMALSFINDYDDVKRQSDIDTDEIAEKILSEGYKLKLNRFVQEDFDNIWDYLIEQDKFMYSQEFCDMILEDILIGNGEQALKESKGSTTNYSNVSTLLANRLNINLVKCGSSDRKMNSKIDEWNNLSEEEKDTFIEDVIYDRLFGYFYNLRDVAGRLGMSFNETKVADCLEEICYKWMDMKANGDSSEFNEIEHLIDKLRINGLGG